MKLIILAAILISIACAKSIEPSRSGRIVGGQDASPLRFRYQAFLEVHTRTQTHFCGGTVISSRSVLTSAHCVFEAVDVIVKVGVTKVNEDSEATRQTFKVGRSGIKIHENFDERLILNDIAILTIAETIEFSEFVGPIELSTAFESRSGEIVTMSGFGQVSDAHAQLSNTLQSVDVTVLENDICQRTYGNLVTANNICTSGDRGRGACHSDYGGPLVAQRNGEAILIGVISYGWPVCQSGRPTVHVDVAKYAEFIAQFSL